MHSKYQITQVLKAFAPFVVIFPIDDTDLHRCLWISVLHKNLDFF